MIKAVQSIILTHLLCALNNKVQGLLESFCCSQVELEGLQGTGLPVVALAPSRGQLHNSKLARSCTLPVIPNNVSTAWVTSDRSSRGIT